MYPALLTQERVFMSLTQANFFESLSLNQKYTLALYRHLLTAFPTMRILVKITTVVMQIYLTTLSSLVTLKTYVSFREWGLGFTYHWSNGLQIMLVNTLSFPTYTFPWGQALSSSWSWESFHGPNGQDHSFKCAVKINIFTLSILTLSLVCICPRRFSVNWKPQP